MMLTVVERVQVAGDWHIGYLDQRPAIGNNRGEWFLLETDAVIHNPGQGLVWIVKLDDGVWECIHEKHWPTETIAPPITSSCRPDYIETADRQGVDKR